MVFEMAKKRVIVYGDIHGCLEEFKLLRKKIKPTKKDIEVVVGDFLNKGLYSLQTLRYIKKHSILSVVGNNEERVLKEFKKGKTSNYHDKDIKFLKSLPYYLRIKNITIVHGGIPLKVKLNKKLTKEQKKEITMLRYYDKELNSLSWKEKDRLYKYWGELYDGRDGFVVYGHNPFKKPRKDKFAIGIDTGCVYGGELTAIVFKKKKKNYDTNSYELVSVKPKRVYFS